MINKPSRSKDLDIRIPSIIPIKGRGVTNQGFALMSWSGEAIILPMQYGDVLLFKP